MLPPPDAGAVHDRSTSVDEMAVAIRLVGAAGWVADVVVVATEVVVVVFVVVVALFAAALLTVTETAGEVPTLPAASYAFVDNEWVPFVSVAVLSVKT
jgi:hypothetical protein